MNSKNNPLVSIIIPAHILSPRFFSDLQAYSHLTHTRTEIIVVTDEAIQEKFTVPVRHVVTHKKMTGPAEKRDLAISLSRGTYCAFIDDDAYPHPDWLRCALERFKKNRDIVAVGGPGITPQEDSEFSQYGGLVYESIVTSGLAQHRFISENQKVSSTQDWPAYNLIVKTDVLKKVGGYGNTFYGGEDTFLCLKLIQHGIILYDPKVIVYHHRRPLYGAHLKQIYNVGVHRGFFFKKFPKTSRKLFYTLPSVLTVGFWAMFFLSFFSQTLALIFLSLTIFFFFIAALTVIKKTSLYGTMITTFGIIFTHMSYGIGFIHGLTKRELSR